MDVTNQLKDIHPSDMPTVNFHTSQLKLFTLTGIAGG